MRRISLMFVIASVVCIACDDDDENDYKMDSAKFMQQVASSGKFEVSTGTLASTKATNEEVKDFGEMMVTDHTKANNELKSLASQKKVTLPDTMDQAKQSKYVALSGQTGVQFDKAYIDEMVLAHTMDVAKFDSASKFANDAEVRSWAAKTLPVLQMHKTHVMHLDTLTNNL